MSKEGASADLQAAAYWKNVLRLDRAEIGVAVPKVTELTKAARSDEVQPTNGARRTKGLSGR